MGSSSGRGAGGGPSRTVARAWWPRSASCRGGRLVGLGEHAEVGQRSDPSAAWQRRRVDVRAIRDGAHLATLGSDSLRDTRRLRLRRGAGDLLGTRRRMVADPAVHGPAVRRDPAGPTHDLARPHHHLRSRSPRVGAGAGRNESGRSRDDRRGTGRPVGRAVAEVGQDRGVHRHRPGLRRLRRCWARGGQHPPRGPRGTACGRIRHHAEHLQPNDAVVGFLRALAKGTYVALKRPKIAELVTKEVAPSSGASRRSRSSCSRVSTRPSSRSTARRSARSSRNAGRTPRICSCRWGRWTRGPTSTRSSIPP